MKRLFLAPGPVEAPAWVMKSIAQAVVHHRTPHFEAFFGALQEGLQYLFQTEGFTTAMIGSGTQGVEAVMYSLIQEGSSVVVACNGKFSERWRDYGRLRGARIHAIEKKWGEAFSPQEIVKGVTECKEKEGRVNAVVLTHCETSTGTWMDLEEVALRIKIAAPEALIIVDAITTVGVIPFYFDAWEIDCAVISSQKALMNPAGTVYFALSEKAVAALRPTDFSDYSNLHNYLERFPYTAPVQLLYGVKAVLDNIQEQGLPTIWNRTHLLASYFQAEVTKMGGQLFSQLPSESLSSFSLPVESHSDFRQYLREKHAIIVGGGQGSYANKLMRVSHMGEVTSEMMERVIAAIQGGL